MTTPDLVGLFVEPLERIGIPYMITGGVASVIYGDPRFTRDIDIVLVLDRAGVPTLRTAFEGGDFYVPPEEAMEREVERAGGGTSRSSIGTLPSGGTSTSSGTTRCTSGRSNAAEDSSSTPYRSG